MRGIKAYTPQGRTPPVMEFLDGLEPKFRERVLIQLVRLSVTPRTELKEPHYKHFVIEKYRDLYEVRAKGKVLVRIIFTVSPGGDILLIHAFVKRQKRDTMQALEQSLKILADIREHPEYAVEFKFEEEQS